MVPSAGPQDALPDLLGPIRPDQSAAERPRCSIRQLLYPVQRAGLRDRLGLQATGDADRGRRGARPLLPDRLLALFRHRGQGLRPLPYRRHPAQTPRSPRYNLQRPPSHPVSERRRANAGHRGLGLLSRPVDGGQHGAGPVQHRLPLCLRFLRRLEFHPCDARRRRPAARFELLVPPPSANADRVPRPELRDPF